MVRVISVHHFASQDIHTCEEPLAVTTAPVNKLLLALPQHVVEVRDLNKGGIVIFTFPTVDRVFQMVHCCQGNYIATLESKKNRQGKEAVYARIYANWDMNCKTQPMRARIAGRVTPSSQSSVNSLEMIELPVKRSPNVITCCQVSGNILIGSHKTLVLYQFHVRTHDISKMKFIDFEESLSFEMSFCASSISLCENMVSCMSKENFHVFKVFCEEPEEERKHVKKKMEEKNKLLPVEFRKRHKRKGRQDNVHSKRHIEWDQLVKYASMDSHSFKEEVKEKLPVHPNSFPIVVHLPTIVEQNKNLSANQMVNVQKRTGPFCDEPLEMVVKVFKDPLTPSKGTPKICNLLQLQLLACSKNSKEEFRCMSIKPMYVTDVEGEEDRDSECGTSANPMLSRYFNKLASIACFVATQQEGYLYYFSNLDSSTCVPGGRQQPNCIAVYPFTAPVSSVVLERYILHGLTETGLETYTLRAGHYLIQELEKVDNVNTACPSPDDPVCLIGLRPFFGVEYLVVADSYLVLLACSEGSSTSSQDSQGGGWTLYSLQLPTAADLYKDILQVALVHRTSSPATYLHLLGEGHVVLRIALQCYNWIMSSGQVVRTAYPKIEDTDERVQRIREFYKESCGLLGDYYVSIICLEPTLQRLLEMEEVTSFCVINQVKQTISCDSETNWKLAHPYYKMSTLSAPEVVERVIRSEETATEEKPRKYQGLIHYLKHTLLQNDAEVIPVPFANTLLDLFEEHDPGEVSTLVLHSNILREYKMDRVLQIMKKQLCSRASPEPQDALALVLLCIQKGSLEQARTVLNSLTSTQLVEVLLDNWNLLINTVPRKIATFSDTALVLMEVKPEVFATVLLKLICEDEVLSLHEVLQMFLESLPSCIASASGPKKTNFILQIFLEQYFVHFFRSNNKLDTNLTHIEAMKILIRSYLSGLSESSLPPIEQENKSVEELFGHRYSFLQKLSPACNPTDSSKGSQVLGKSSQQCNLIKLQSLLCSSCLTKDCILEVAHYLDSHENAYGHLSLRILCSSSKEAVNVILDSCPQCLLQYGKDKFQTDNEWRYLLIVLQRKIQNAEDTTMKVLYLQIMKDVLHHLAQTVSLEDFIKMLPAGDPDVYQPYIRTCQQVQHANHVRALIMATGQQLLSTLNL